MMTLLELQALHVGVCDIKVEATVVSFFAPNTRAYLIRSGTGGLFLCRIPFWI